VADVIDRIAAVLHQSAKPHRLDEPHRGATIGFALKGDVVHERARRAI
jgi:hypothetical protein